MKLTTALALSVLLFSVVGCDKLKGPQGETGATGAQGNSGPSGDSPGFFEFTGQIPPDGFVSIGQLSSDSLVAAFYSTTDPATNWFPAGVNNGLNEPSVMISYQTGIVTYSSTYPGWLYKIIVIHNPSGQSASLMP